MLRLTKKADYSLIALKLFASRKGMNEEALSAKELADASGIPLPILSKLLQRLGKSGFLESAYGTNGGYRLAREPREISVLEVIRAIDGPIVLANCFTHDTSCGHSGRCTVRRPLRRIHEGILHLLESVSVADMLEDAGGEEPLAVAATSMFPMHPSSGKPPGSGKPPSSGKPPGSGEPPLQLR